MLPVVLVDSTNGRNIKNGRLPSNYLTLLQINSKCLQHISMFPKDNESKHTSTLVLECIKQANIKLQHPSQETNHYQICQKE